MILDNPFTNDKRVFKEAKSLVNYGYDVTVLCKNEPDLRLPTAEIVEGIKIKRLCKYNLGTSVLIDKYLQAHIDFYNNLDERFDLYHCHDPETWPIGYMLAKKDQAKFICDSHEYFPDYICKEWYSDSFKYEFTKMLVQARGNYLSNADGVIVISEDISDVLYEELQLKEKPTALYNSRPKSDYKFTKNELRERYDIPEGCTILLFQGTVEPTRGVDIAIQAMKYIKDSVLVIAGGDRNGYINELKQLASDWGVEDRVIFTGFMPSDRLLEYTFYADIMVYFGRPVVENMEYSIPNKFFDYIFAEKPMVIGDLRTLNKLVEKYKIGKIIDIHDIDIEKIGSVINQLITDPELCRMYSENAKKIKEHFLWEKQEEKLLKLYGKVLG